MKVKLKFLQHYAGPRTLSYASAGSSGADLSASIDDDVVIEPRQRLLIPNGIILELPLNYEAQIRPRSGLALKHGVTVLNSPGTIDSDYRGEVKTILINHGNEPFIITKGMKIAQMVIVSVESTVFLDSDDLSNTERGIGGFGSTGF